MFYYIAGIREGTIKVLRQSSENEVKKIENLQEPIKNLYLQNRRIERIVKAFKKISTINASLLYQKDEYSIDDLNDAISDYLSRFRKFLNNWEAYLKRTFGIDSTHYATFKQATADAYDYNPEYQIVYGLRNADQHCCDSIVTTIRMGVDDDGAYYIEAKAKCEYLLTEFKEWKAVEKKYLQANTEIDIFKCISVANKCVREIHQKTLNCFFSMKLYENCYKILGYANEFQDNREGLVFFRQEEELTKEFWMQPKKELNTISWMIEKCIALLTMHLKNNTSVVSVLYRGDFSSGNLDEYAVNLDKEGNKAGIEIGHMVKIDDIDYLCYSRTIELVKDLETDLVINTAIASDKEIKERFMRIVDVLVWKKCLNEE